MPLKLIGRLTKKVEASNLLAHLKEKPIEVFVKGLLILVALWVLYGIFGALGALILPYMSIEKLGQWGDSYGAFNAFFTASAFVAIAITLYLQNETLKTQREELQQQREELSLTRTEYHLNRMNSEVQFTRLVVEDLHDGYSYNSILDGKFSWQRLNEVLSDMLNGTGYIEIEKFDDKGCGCGSDKIDHSSINYGDPTLAFEHIKLCCGEDIHNITSIITSVAQWIESITNSLGRSSIIIDDKALKTQYTKLVKLIIPPLISKAVEVIKQVNSKVPMSDSEWLRLVQACDQLQKAEAELNV